MENSNKIKDFPGFDASEFANNRPSWDEYFIKISRLAASRSSSNKLKVGCIIVKENRIVSSGYNGHFSGCEHITITRDNHEVSIVHAEMNAISDAAKRGVSIDNSTAYITHRPCLNCTLLLIASGIKCIIYDEEYKNDEIATKLLDISGVKIFKFKENP
jgi:dCMP deaminase